MRKFLSICITIICLLGYMNINADQKAIAVSENVRGKTLQIGGQPFGIKFYSEGAMVTKVRDNSPADKGGLKENDVIIAIDNNKTKTNEVVKQIVKNSNGKEMIFTINRDYQIINISITPEMKNGKYTAGMWIKDSCAGIGTITYYDKDNHTFACLGHGICDKNSSVLLPMSEGTICPAIIESIDKGENGSPGGLNGYFKDEEIGQAYYNSPYGLFCTSKFDTYYDEYKVATRDEVKNGDAYIYTTVNGDTPKYYKAEIKLKSKFNFDKMKELIVEIKDEELIDKTGGIVQGMSGSPIIQGDKIVGAVTHVFVNNPEKGYGILVETMLQKSKG